MSIILKTDRLLLRYLAMEDLDELFILYQDPEIRRYFPDGVKDYEETKEELEWFLNGHPEHPELGLWATIHKETGKFIGRCGLLPWEIDGKLDVLSGLEQLQVCTGYKMNGEAVRYADVDAYGLGNVECIYQTVPGWKEDISKAKSFEELPVNAQSYVKIIEDAVGVPVKWIWVGPESDATIRR